MTLLSLPAPSSGHDSIVDLVSLCPGDQLDTTLRICGIEQRFAGDKPFAVLTVGNCTGELATAPFWTEELPRLAGLGKGQLVDVTGELTTYRGSRQLRISTIARSQLSSIDWRLFLPSVGDVSGYWEILDAGRHAIAGPRLRDTLSLFYDDPIFRQRYQECPASLHGHHSALGGLLRHTWEVAGIARAVSRTCPADGDLVLAGVLLHDIGKIAAYRWDGIFEYTTPGHLQGHVVLGALMLENRVRGREQAPCTDEELMTLHHLILSHHGRLEYGAPVQPMTLEAEILHYADNASAKSASMADALTDADNFMEDEVVSTRGVWQVDRRRICRAVHHWGKL